MYSGLLVDVAVKTHMPEIPVPGGKLQPVPESAPSQVQKPLSVDALAVGDRAAIFALGIAGAEALKQWGLAVFAVDVLGQVQILHPSAIQLLVKPRIKDEELDKMDETNAIQVMLAQSDSEEAIRTYLHNRAGRI
jgi:hypothetical protein